MKERGTMKLYVINVFRDDCSYPESHLWAGSEWPVLDDYKDKLEIRDNDDFDVVGVWEMGEVSKATEGLVTHTYTQTIEDELDRRMDEVMDIITSIGEGTGKRNPVVAEQMVNRLKEIYDV